MATAQQSSQQSKLLAACSACAVAVIISVLISGGIQRPGDGIAISGKRVASQLRELASFSVDAWPAVTRVLFTQADQDARRYIKGLMADAGLAVREDGMGNIFGRFDGSEPGAPAVTTGSHIDAIPLSGAYDGTLGVVGGIEALRALKASGYLPRRPIDVIMFTSEEPTRFGIGCIGSRAMVGRLTASTLAGLKDENGTGWCEAASAAGYPTDSVQSALSRTRLGGPTTGVHAFVELHIEQGPELEKQGLQLGVVTAIAAPATLRVAFHGSGGHAGALLMPLRQDAGLAAAELQLHVESATLEHGAIDAVGTVGRLELSPNAVNSVPRTARMEIDVRDIDAGRRDATVQSIIAAAKAIAARRGVRHEVEILNQDPPATCDPQVVAAEVAAAEKLGARWQKMVSRAYHDSLFMAQQFPASMIFIPCRGGVSHRPDEFAAVADIQRGVHALALTLAELAGNGSVTSD